MTQMRHRRASCVAIAKLVSAAVKVLIWADKMLSPEPEADMRRREFLGVLSSAAIAWPLAAGAQQAGGMRRIGVLMASAVDDSEFQARIRILKGEKPADLPVQAP